MNGNLPLQLHWCKAPSCRRHLTVARIRVVFITIVTLICIQHI